MRPPVPYPHAPYNLAGPGAPFFGGAPAVLAGDRPRPGPISIHPGVDAERGALGDPCFDPEQAGDAKGGR